MPSSAPTSAPWVRVLQAADTAAREHRTHRRRGDAASPYINHVAEVARILAESSCGTDADLVAAAWLHDLPPKSGWTEARMADDFGAEIAAIVFETQLDRDEDRELRREKEIAKAPHMSPQAKQLKLADKTSSVLGMIETPPPDWGREEEEHYLRWAEAVADGCAGVNPRLDEMFREAVRRCRAKHDA